MKPCFTRAARGLLVATLLLATISLTAQDAEQKTTYLEGYFSRLGKGPDNSNTFLFAADYQRRIIAGGNVHTGLGVGVRRVSTSGWYTRYAIMNLSFRGGDLDVQDISFGNPVGRNVDSQTAFNSYFRIERGHYFKTTNRIQFGLGATVDPHFLLVQTEPLFPQNDPIRFNQVSLSAGINPSANVTISERTRLLVEIPISLITFGYSSMEYDSPLIIEDRRRQALFNFDALNRLQVSLGLQVRL